jgi:AcrR family transcriptional regulator
MKILSKGEQTRIEILQKTNDFFNQYGINHTITEIAQQTGLGKSKITNYFPKKEALFIAILEEYNFKISEVVSYKQELGQKFNFLWYVDYLSDIMDLMYQYRVVINYSLIEGQNLEMNHHIKDSYLNNKELLLKRVEYMESLGLIDSQLLNESEFRIFLLQYFSISSFWINIFQRMEIEKAYSEVKTEYLEAILACFKPYLTQKGKSELKLALENFQFQEA